MCGLAGVYERAGEAADRSLLLAIVDLAGGDQPLSDERGRFWAMQNGEIYNHVELRSELERLGHVFATTSDTEVIAHAYAEWGEACLRRFNGDFALAVWDAERRELFLARDRFGIRPLFIAELGRDFCFASEAKALLRHPRARRELDPAGVADVLTAWATLPGRSAFAGIGELAPGHCLRVAPGRVGTPRRWWDIDFAPVAADEDDLVDELHELLVDATRLRLRADVPVAAYLSGGLDSSALAAIAAGEVTDLRAFGVGFEDGRFDESAEQDTIAAVLGMEFQRTMVGAPEIAAALPRVVALGEKPLLRTAPAPLLLLSGSVRAAGLKVVLTGEGADELFAGYDIFREDQVRRFWARDPESRLRPQLFGRLNRFLATDPARAGAFVRSFYGRGLLDVGDPLYSHRLRFANTGRCLGLLDPQFAERGGAPAERLLASLPAAFSGFSPLGRAQYLEITTFLEGYLLHAQGDRMLMGNAIEGRFPYLDYRVAEFAARLPDSLRLRGLQEKYVLRRAVRRHLPPAISERTKVPYRAPIRDAFFGASRPDYVRDLLAPGSVRAAGVLDPVAVGRLVAKFEAGRPVSETDEMALMGSLSLMLLHEQFVAKPVLARSAEATRIVNGRETLMDRQLAEAA